MRIRQVVLVAADLEATRRDLTSVFGIEESHRDPADYAGLGIVNVVMPLGRDFLEVVSPIRPTAAAARYLTSTGGDGGYMVIVQFDHFGEAIARAESAGVRFVYREDFPDQRQWHIHPKDIGGAIVALDWADPPEGWRWAGDDWMRRVNADLVSGIRGIELSSPDPTTLADRWSSVLGGALVRNGHAATISLGESTVHFASWDQPFDRVTAIDVAAPDPARLLERASSLGFGTGAGWIDVRGVRYKIS